MNLKNTIIHYYRDFELNHVSRNIADMVIEESNQLVGYLRITDYSCLKSIQLRDSSLQNILSLTITNNPQLKSISCGMNACFYTAKVEISSLTVL